MQTLDLDSAVTSCTYYPLHVDLSRRVLWFARIDHEVYRRAGFLAPKHTAMSEERYGFNLDDVLLRDLSFPIGGAQCNYIFISAFCCSTLLARLLDRVPGCLVLKEPSILGQLAMLRYRPRSAERNEHWEEEWQTWAALAMRLLTRTFEPEQTVIVKGADTCNAMLDVILANASHSKAVLLSVELRTFILSVLKAEERREWTRKRAAFWHKVLTLFPTLSAVDVQDLDDSRKAAYLWLITAALWGRFGKQVAPNRLLLMDGEEISEEPEKALSKVTGFFNLPITQDRIQEILADPVLGRHAKLPDRAYDAARRREDLADWELRFGEEADRAMEWAALIQKQLESDGVDLIAMSNTKREELVL